MSTSSHEYLTVAEAAELLRVSVSTIRRWVREGTMSAHRVGRRRLLLKRGELIDSIHALGQEPQSIDPQGIQQPPPQPAMPGPAEDETVEKHIRQLRAQLGLPPEGDVLDLSPLPGRIVRSPEPIIARRLTPEEKARALVAMQQATALSDDVLARNGGHVFPPSWQIIDDARDELSRRLKNEPAPDANNS